MLFMLFMSNKCNTCNRLNVHRLNPILIEGLFQPTIQHTMEQTFPFCRGGLAWLAPRARQVILSTLRSIVYNYGVCLRACVHSLTAAGSWPMAAVTLFLICSVRFPPPPNKFSFNSRAWRHLVKYFFLKLQN